MASESSPRDYPSGRGTGLDEVAAASDAKVFHSGTRRRNGRWETTGGRVLGVNRAAATWPRRAHAPTSSSGASARRRALAPRHRSGRGLIVSLAEALARLARGELVAYPTETVYGLGADPFQPAALARLLAAKGRDAERGLSLLVADADALARHAPGLPPTAARLARASGRDRSRWWFRFPAAPSPGWQRRSVSASTAPAAADRGGPRARGAPPRWCRPAATGRATPPPRPAPR